LQPLQQGDIVLGTTPLEDITVTVMDKVEMAHVDAARSREMMRHAGTVVLRISKSGYQTREVVLRTSPDRLVEHRVVLEPLP
jgi:hypothetical protein